MVLEPSDFDPAPSQAMGTNQKQEKEYHSSKDFREVVCKVWEDIKYPLFRYLISLGVNDKDDAEDIIHDGFEKLLKERAKLLDADIKIIKAWIYKTCHNLAIDRYRKDRRQRPLSIDRYKQDKEGQEFKMEFGDQGFEEEVCNAISNKKLCQELLHHLSEEEQKYLLLRYVVGMKPQEIAQAQSLSPGCVSTRLSRALAHARAILKGQGNT